jgi:hypothetical protein
MASLATSQTTFRCALPPSTLRRLTASRPIRPPARKQEQRRQCRALPVTEARRSNSGDRRQSPAVQVNPTKLLKEYGLPALGLLVAASVVAPLLGGLVFGAVALGVMASFSWIFVPVILALFGLPALMAAGEIELQPCLMLDSFALRDTFLSLDGCAHGDVTDSTCCRLATLHWS